MDSKTELRRRMYALDGPAGEFEQVKKAIRLDKLLSPQLDQNRHHKIVINFEEKIDDQSKLIDKLRKEIGEKPDPVDELQKEIDEKPAPVDELQKEIDEKQALVDELQKGIEKEQALVDELQKGIDERLALVDELQKGIDEKLAPGGELRKGTDQKPLMEAWVQFVKIDNDSRQLFKKCLTFVQGALARKEDIDGGVCQLADKLLHDLSTYANIDWYGFTILDKGEYLLESTEIIKMRFPDTSIWSLPLAAHEFGHFLGPELKDKSKNTLPYLVKLDQKNQEKERNYYQEYFADIFATMSLGPAFACSLILHRFSPATASVDPTTHPNDSKRVRAILWVLEKMGDPDKSHNQNYYNDIINFLRSYWNQGLENTGQPEFEGAGWKKLKNELNDIYEMIDQYTYKDLPYKNVDWLRSKAFSFKFKQDDYQPEFENPPNLTRRDVLNAAWYCRLFAEKKKSADRIAEQAMDVFKNID